jgi:putative heme iron utilization protein
MLAEICLFPVKFLWVQTIWRDAILLERQADDMENDKSFCPCMPQCPNYGNCRECIAAHAKFYTVPKCIKLMQDEMKEKHIHPSNPHVKKTLGERVADFYAENPGAHLRTVAESLKITEYQLLEAMPEALNIPTADFGDIYNALTELDAVMLHADTGSVVLQLTTPLPAAIDMRGTKIIKRESGDMSLTSLIMTGGFYAVFLVRETLYGGKESLSLALVGEDEKIALSIYMRRSDANTIEQKSKDLFEMLWTKYSK